MTATSEAVSDAPRPPAWVAPRTFAAHAAALAALLTVAAVLVGPGAFSADEGAAIVQARALASGEGWIVDHPFPEADPEGRAYPYEFSLEGDRGIAPFAKHPVYAAMLGVGQWSGGRLGMALWSVLGTTLAAVAAGRLALRVEPSTALWALWIVGVGSPLLFSASLLIAHAPAAGVAGLTALAAAGHLERGRLAGLVALVAATVALVALRTEGLLFAGALALALLVVGGGTRARAGALAVGAGAALGYVGNTALQAAVVGGVGPSQPPSGVAGGSFIDDRITAFTITWIRPAYDPVGTGGAVALLGVLLLAAGVFLLGRRFLRPAVVVSAVGAALVVLRLVVESPRPVPGLLVAFPVLVAGIAAAPWIPWSNRVVRLLAITVGLSWAAVLATQYRAGGTGEWGGRYFTLGIPLVVPLALAGLAHLRRDAPGPARAVLVSLAVATVATSVLSLAVMARAHRDTVALADEVAEVSERPAGDGAPPVIVATAPFVPRMIWDLADERRILLVPHSDDDHETHLADVVGRLADEGVERWTFVTARTDDLGPEVVGERFEVGEPRRATDRSVWSIYPIGPAIEQVFASDPLS